MFSKLAILATLSLAAFAAADGGKCNTGEIQCCNQVQQSNSVGGRALLKRHGLSGVAGQGATGMVGSNCSPISAIGVGSGGKCKSQPMCCENNHYEGLVVVGCTPINIDL